MRKKYLRPIVLGVIGGIFAEIMFILVQGVILYPGQPIWVMAFWGFFCGVGMGALAGVFLDVFVVDRFEGKSSILWGTTVAFVPYAACGYFCYEIALNVNYYGAREMGMIFVYKNMILSFVGALLISLLLFTERGRAVCEALRL
ncbi:hypothetical protein [Ruegeria jejuensis]|uniref:hypothetical protein n=1 Tax=Ruegeria jejuensis TaxID=3233338 RepID=UPI00355BCA33